MIKYLNEAQLEALFKAARRHPKGIEYELMLRLMSTYALRASELTALKLQSFTPDIRQPVEVFIEADKGGISRSYPLADDVARLLKKWLPIRAAILRGREDSPYLFVPVQGRSPRLLYITVQKRFEAIAKQAGLPEGLRHSHTMRHSAAVRLLSSGADLFFVSLWLRHKSIQSTMVYANLAPSGWTRLSSLAIQALTF